MRRIGIDVGGTNTDAVLLDGGRVAAKAKTADDAGRAVRYPRRARLRSGTVRRHARRHRRRDDRHDPFHQRRRPSGAVWSRWPAIRIGLPASRFARPPSPIGPATCARRSRGRVFTVEGGHEYDGRPLVDLDEPAIAAAGRAIAAAGIRRAAGGLDLLAAHGRLRGARGGDPRRECPDCQVTLSHEIGRIGLLERENAALLNACLGPLAPPDDAGVPRRRWKGRRPGRPGSTSRRTTAPCSWPNGPNATRSSASPRVRPTPCAGRPFLSGRPDGMVVDVGGTTTDIGMLRSGFPARGPTMSSRSAA